MPERHNPEIANYILSQVFGDSSTPTGQAIDAFNKATDDQTRKRAKEFMEHLQSIFHDEGGRFITLQNDPTSGYKEEVMLSPDLTIVSHISAFDDSTSPYLLSRDVKLKLDDSSSGASPVALRFNQIVREDRSGLESAGRTSLELLTTPGMEGGIEVCLNRFATNLDFIAHFSGQGELESLSFPGDSMSEKRYAEGLEKEEFERENPPSQTTKTFMDKMQKELEAILEASDQDMERFKHPFVRIQLFKREAGMPFGTLIFPYRDFALYNFESLLDVAANMVERMPLSARSRRQTVHGRNLDVWISKRNLRLQYEDVDGSVGIGAVVPLKISIDKINDLLNSHTRDWMKVKDFLPFRIAVPAFGIEIDNIQNYPQSVSSL